MIVVVIITKTLVVIIRIMIKKIIINDKDRKSKVADFVRISKYK